MQKQDVFESLVVLGRNKPGVARKVAAEIGRPEADVYGVSTFYHLLEKPDVELRVCQGLSCRMQGSREVLAEAQANGVKAEACQCLGACDRPVPLLLKDRQLFDADISNWREQFDEAQIDPSRHKKMTLGQIGGISSGSQSCFGLDDEHDYSLKALQKCFELSSEEIIEEVKSSGLQGRGGAGFPAHIKWSALLAHQNTQKYIVLNADEGEPGTFKDRELMIRRPDKVLEGLLIAAKTVDADSIYCYVRGEFFDSLEALKEAEQKIRAHLKTQEWSKDWIEGITIHFHEGHGAYICGEETALLEALEGKRGMPRLKPPFPTDRGLYQKPTLIHNVETIASLPFILNQSGQEFSELGRTGAGSKLYCISGDIQKPGVYELPLGITLDEFVIEAGGYIGSPQAFSPGGASSGFLPMTLSNTPLDFKSLSAHGTMLGSAGLVVLNDKRDLLDACLTQLEFFSEESCGQCAPCRIGTHFLKERMQDYIRSEKEKKHLEYIEDVSWEMQEGSICGLGQIASLPMTSLQKYFPHYF